MNPLPRTPLALLLFFGSALSVLGADPVTMTAIGKAAPLKFAEPDMVMESDGESLRVQAPGFWNLGWQVVKPVLPDLAADGSARLAIVAEGASANELLVLKLRFVSADWKRADVYEIPLTGLASGDPQEFTASTPFGEPSEKEGEGLTAGETVGALQFVFSGKGKSPVQLTIKTIGLR